MAALLTHVVPSGKSKFLQNLIPTTVVSVRHKRGPIPAKVKESKPFIVKKPERVAFKSVTDSLASRGFLRNYKEYNPPENAKEKVKAICSNILSSSELTFTFRSNEQKARVLVICGNELDYKIPNSILPEINTIGDVVKFYTTPIKTTVSYDDLKNMDLPPNLHIISNYRRFHPETDTMFNGITAFPKSSNLVVGLKTREKYKGFYAGNPFTDV